MKMIRILLCAAFLAHIACGYCDCLLSYGKKGRLDLKAIKDPERMRETFADVPLWQPMVSILLGIFSITVFTFGYLALSSWMFAYKQNPFLYHAGCNHCLRGIDSGSSCHLRTGGMVLYPAGQNRCI